MASISKKLTLFSIALLLLISMTQAARSVPADLSNSHHLEGVGQVIADNNEESCDGVAEEECLARRTLVAHTDYIYTQGKGN